MVWFGAYRSGPLLSGTVTLALNWWWWWWWAAWGVVVVVGCGRVWPGGTRGTGYARGREQRERERQEQISMWRVLSAHIVHTRKHARTHACTHARTRSTPGLLEMERQTRLSHAPGLARWPDGRLTVDGGMCGLRTEVWTLGGSEQPWRTGDKKQRHLSDTSAAAAAATTDRRTLDQLSNQSRSHSTTPNTVHRPAYFLRKSLLTVYTDTQYLFIMQVDRRVGCRTSLDGTNSKRRTCGVCIQLRFHQRGKTARVLLRLWFRQWTCQALSTRDLNGGADAAHMDKEDGDRRYFISRWTDGRTNGRPAGRGGHSKRTPSLRDLGRPGPRFWRVPLERSPGPDGATDGGDGFPDRDRSAGGRSI